MRICRKNAVMVNIKIFEYFGGIKIMNFEQKQKQNGKDIGWFMLTEKLQQWCTFMRIQGTFMLKNAHYARWLPKQVGENKIKLTAW